MKVDPNAPAYPTSDVTVSRSSRLTSPFAPGVREGASGITIRLAIAAQIMAAETAYSGLSAEASDLNRIDASLSLARADALIAAYNEGQ